MKTIFLLGNFIVSISLTYLTIRLFSNFEQLGQDHQDKVQKFHSGSVPRVAGIPLYVTGVIASIFSSILWPDTKIFLLILLSALPILTAGIVEDLTAKGYAYLRLFASVVSAFIFIYFTGLYVFRAELAWLDSLLGSVWFAYPFTVLAIAGVTNGFNIIDGFNGLAAITSILFAFGIALVGFNEDDFVLAFIAGSFAASLFGFLYFNFPAGRIFLGDGGAYLVGFLLATTSILAIYNKSISPVVLLLLAGYPVIETVFSFVRKTFVSGKHPFYPDHLHLHMLVYRWLAGKYAQSIAEGVVKKEIINPMVSLYMLPFLMLPVLVVFFEHNNSEELFILFLGYVVLYLIFYTFLFRHIRANDMVAADSIE